METSHLMKRRCTAKSKTTGKRCRKPPIPGGGVCHVHGGGAPQVRKKARERLAALVDPAIDRLGVLVRDEDDKRVALAAAKDILDRCNLGGKKKVELEHSSKPDMMTAEELRARAARIAAGTIEDRGKAG